ncbi:VWA domain-containing protein [Candidatus Micrarchaeota archaeon]|nr:VWA domain-containing protein [Candidatus Micrarchaeota archaeon]
MEITFENPIYLYFLVLIPLLVVVHFYSMKHVRRRALMFANFEAIERVTGGEVLPKNYVLLGIRVASLTLFVLAISGATLIYEIQSSAFDAVVAVDVSGSMAAKDVLPDRLSAVKGSLDAFFNSLPPGSKTGIVSFSSVSAVVKNLTTDVNQVRLLASMLQPQSAGGTAIGDALFTSTNVLLQSGRPKAIILITDGQSNVGIPVSEAVHYVKNNNVRVFTVGVGTTSGGGSENLPEVSFTLDEETLKTIAGESKGAYFNAGDANKLHEVFVEIGRESGQKKERLNLIVPFVFLSFLLVFFDWSISGTKYRIIP